MKKLLYIFFILLSLQCREKFNMAIDTPNSGLLVVEGFINTNTESIIRLSHATKLDTVGIVPETAATVVVEGEDNSVYSFIQLDSGRYLLPQINFPAGIKHRLKIITFDNREYVSDFRESVVTQEIDSVSYASENENVRFFVNSTDDQQQKYFFKYDYEETWQFNSAFRTTLKFTVTGPPQDPTVTIGYSNPDKSVDTTIFTCWRTHISTEITIGNTNQLSTSKIYLPVRQLRRDSWELGNIYSILVKQSAMTEDGYDFFRRLKKNSESLGSIFDAQPTELQGNITCVNDPNEQVVGFVEFTELKEKRLFVKSADLPGTPFDDGCRVFGGENSLYPYPFTTDPQVLVYVYKDLGKLPTVPVQIIPLTFMVADPLCIDCTLRGTNVKPGFWP